MQQEIKIIGASGQITIGKEHAGRTVLVEQLEPGVWMIRTVQVIPDNERWLHSSPVRESLDRALEVSAKTERSQSDIEALARKVRRSK